MKGDIMNCSAHTDIYFLDPSTKNETTDLANLFASPTNRDVFKYKPRLKIKQKLTPTLEFFLQNTPRSSALDGSSDKSSSGPQDDVKCPSGSSNGTTAAAPVRARRRSSIDLYEEAASILGLTCLQTDDCKCLECQCHYFDFEEELSTGSDCVVEMDHTSSCSIQ